jgi:conjugal transfer pilus assembly protein TraU
VKLVKSIILSVGILFTASGFTAESTPPSADENASCSDAKIFEKIIDQVCWSCFLPMNIMGVGDKPDGASESVGICNCPDKLGVPEFGWPLGGLQPVRLNEVVQQPWCSPSLGGVQLQDSVGMGGTHGSDDGNFFMNYHYFSYPLFKILQIFMLGDCDYDAYSSFDLMYMSELDPTWSDDMLSMLLTKEAFLFANPVVRAACVADGISITATGKVVESMYMCAGTDGGLYPLTGNVISTADPAKNSSLITQRVLAGLHRKGLAMKTMGNEEMCKPTYIPFVPRSQYKFSIIHPRPEASSAYRTVEVEGGDPESVYEGGKCCHVPGDSHHKWSTAAGGRHRPGDTDFVWLIWRWTDCCVRETL